MYRSILVGNKTCAARVRKRTDDRHKQRLQDIKPQINNSTPHTLCMPHLKVNRKRDMLLNQRHDEIERTDMMMLYKMHEMARKPDLSKVHRSNSLPVLRGPGGRAAQLEYDRIMLANQQMLHRLRNARGEINMRRLEEQYERSMDYVKLGCEYPPPLLRRRERQRSSASTSVMERLPDEDMPGSGYFTPGGTPLQVPPEELGEDELRYVLREDRLVDGAPFYVEMATDGKILAVSIYDQAADRGYELVVDEENHIQFQQETCGDYSALADRLTIQNEELMVAAAPEVDLGSAEGGEDGAEEEQGEDAGAGSAEGSPSDADHGVDEVGPRGGEAAPAGDVDSGDDSLSM